MVSDSPARPVSGPQPARAVPAVSGGPPASGQPSGASGPPSAHEVTPGVTWSSRGTPQGIPRRQAVVHGRHEDVVSSEKLIAAASATLSSEPGKNTNSSNRDMKNKLSVCQSVCLYVCVCL